MANAYELPRGIKPNKQYKISLAGGGERVGTATMTFYDGKWHIEMGLAVLGAGLFGRVTKVAIEKVKARYKLVEESPVFPPQSEMFAKNVEKGTSVENLPTSFADIPLLRKIIEVHVRNLEKILSSDLVETKIQLHFIDDRQVDSLLKNPNDKADLTSEIFGLHMSALNRALPLIHKKLGWAVIMTPVPDPNVMTPAIWSVYDRTAFFAHELGHVLAMTSENDGFDLLRYPLEGIMNGGAEFKVLQKEFQRDPQITLIDLNTILLGQYASFGLTEKQAIKTFIPNFFSLEGESVGYSEGPKARKRILAAIQLKVKEYRKRRKADTCALRFGS